MTKIKHWLYVAGYACVAIFLMPIWVPAVLFLSISQVAKEDNYYE